MIRKILCPINFSDQSKAGVASAISLAEARCAEFVFFHVTSFPFEEFTSCCEGEFLGIQHTPRFTVDGLLREAEAKVSNFVGAYFANQISTLKWRPKVSLGKVSAEIVAAARQERVDLIVMGKGKRKLFQRFFSGSVSEAVSYGAPCPVLTVCAPQTRDSQGSRGSRIPLWGEPQLRSYS